METQTRLRTLEAQGAGGASRAGFSVATNTAPRDRERLCLVTVPLEETVARLRDAERAAASVVFQTAGVRLRLKREDQFRSLVIELVPSLGLLWMDTLFGSIPARTFTEVVVTSVEPLTEGQLGMLQRTFKRLRIRNVSLPGPAHSRMK